MPLERSIEMHCLSSTALEYIHLCIYIFFSFSMLFVVHVFVTVLLRYGTVKN